jgi:hypothetical protein
MAAKTLWLIISLCFFFPSVGSCTMFSKNKTHFEWLATESAPKNYPMKVLSGTFYYHNEDGGLYIPDAASISAGWGTGVSSHVVGEAYKALPDRLDIRFFSYTENRMYHGSFDLPYDKILALFKAGVAKDKEDPTFKKIMVGVAPGGSVAVWVTGHETREIFFAQAEPYDGVFTDSLNNPVDDVEAYSHQVLESSLAPEVIAEMRKNGIPFDKWKSYRKQYHWLPTFAQQQRPQYVSVPFFSGERYKINFPIDDVVAKERRPIPVQLSFAYLISGETMPDFYTIRFDEQEIFAAFESLGSEELIHIECDPKLPKQLTAVRIFNSKKSVNLKQITHLK